MERTETLIIFVYCSVICAFKAGCAPGVWEAEATISSPRYRTDVNNYNVGTTTGAGGRLKRYTLDGSKWRSKSLSYNIIKYPSRSLNKTVVDQEIARAFALWSNHTDQTFSPRIGKVDIKISFQRGEHGDGHPFDGRRGKQLAHSNYPGPGCQVHFDDDENWTIGTHEGTNLFQVAVHELGHSLGLDHSSIKTSVMNPQYGIFNPNFMLDRDDVAGIQALYGHNAV